MELDGPSDDEAEGDTALADARRTRRRPTKMATRRRERGVAKSAYFARYRAMPAFGFTRSNAEYDRVREMTTDYNIGMISRYAERASFSRNHVCVGGGAAQLCIDECWIYDGESSRYAWATGWGSEIQGKGHYGGRGEF